MIKTSANVFYYQFIAPLLLIYIAYINLSDLFIYGLAIDDLEKITLVGLALLSIFIFQMPLKLRRIEAGDTGITVMGFGNKFNIPYKNIHYVTKYDFTNPWFVTIKYTDEISRADKKISFKPTRDDWKFMNDDLMTVFIKDKIHEHNSKFNIQDQPSKRKNFLIITAITIAFVLFNYLFLQF